MQDIAKTVEWLLQGTEDVVSQEFLAKKLEKAERTKKPLLVKLGVDPTAPDIHLGHTVVMEKLRQFQELGHQVVFLIGDMTGRIGDPTDRTATRKQLTESDVKAFAQTYIDQAQKILDADRMILRYNSEWLAPMDLTKLIHLMSQVTVARILERDDFSRRYREHAPIHLHEFLYPLMQAYDSVALQADVELGGTDQRFNIMTARQIQEAYGMEPEVGIFMPILEGVDGVRRMGKSLGNYIGINEPAEEMFGKVMSIPDMIIGRWAQLLLGQSQAAIAQKIQQGTNPRDLKAQLAFDLVARFWSRDHAENARGAFDRTFRQKEVPDDMPVIAMNQNPWQTSALDLVAGLPGMASGQEARRLLSQGAVSLNGKRLELGQMVVVESDAWIKVGKRRFFRFNFGGDLG